MPHPSRAQRGDSPRRLRWGLALGLALVLAASAVAPVLAQVPPVPEQPVADVQVTAASTRADVEQGSCANFSLTVHNTGRPEIALLEDEVTITVTVTGSGWTLNPNPSGTTFELARGESHDPIPVGLCAGNDVARGAVGQATFRADLADSLAPPGTAPKTTQQVLTAEVPAGGLLGNTPVPSFVLWIALAAVGLLLTTAVLARRRPGAALTMECREPSKEVPAGRGTSFPVAIANEGRSRDLVSLTTSPVPRGWDTFLPVVDVPLEPGESQTVWISVKAPDDAQPGDHIAVKVFARSSAAGGQQASLDLLTTVAGGGAAWSSGGISTGGGDEEERSVYGPEGEAGRAVAVKRRRA